MKFDKASQCSCNYILRQKYRVKYPYSPTWGAISIPMRRSTTIAGEHRVGMWPQQERLLGEKSVEYDECAFRNKNPQEPFVP